MLSHLATLQTFTRLQWELSLTGNKFPLRFIVYILVLGHHPTLHPPDVIDIKAFCIIQETYWKTLNITMSTSKIWSSFQRVFSIFSNFSCKTQADVTNENLLDIHAQIQYYSTVYSSKEKTYVYDLLIPDPNPKNHMYRLFNIFDKNMCMNENRRGSSFEWRDIPTRNWNHPHRHLAD